MSKNTERNTNRFSLKKIVFWVVIGLVVSISMVLLIIKKNHFESTTTIDLSTIVSEYEIQTPFLATLNNSFGVVSSEEGLPFFELFTSENSDEFYLDQIYIDDGFYFSFSNQSQKNPYSSLWYYSYKEKSLSMLMENNEASYTLVSVTPNHNLLELDCFINEKETITTWYNISSESFVDLPEEIRDNIDLVYYLKNQNECILCSCTTKNNILKDFLEEQSYEDIHDFVLENLDLLEPSQFEYYFWNQTEQDFTTIGSGTFGNMTSDGSFFIITDYQKKTTDVFDSETKEVTSIPWIDDFNHWKVWQGSNKIYTTNYLDKSYREIVSPIHVVNLKTMVKKVVELPVENVEVGSEKIIYKGDILFGFVEDNNEALWSLNNDFEWENFFNIDSIDEESFLHYSFQKSSKNICNCFSRELLDNDSFVCTASIDGMDNYFIFNQNKELVLRDKESINIDYSGIYSVLFNNAWQIIRSLNHYDTSINVINLSSGKNNTITDIEIKESIRGLFNVDASILTIQVTGISNKFDCEKIYVDLRYGRSEPFQAQDYLFIKSIAQDKVFSNSNNKGMVFNCWID